METKQTDPEAISWATTGKLVELAHRRYPGVDCVAVIDASAWQQIVEDRPRRYEAPLPSDAAPLDVPKPDGFRLRIERGAAPGTVQLGPSSGCRRDTRWVPVTTYREESTFEFEGPHSNFKVTGV